VRLRATGLEVPLALYAIALFGSVLANPARVADVGSILSKKLAFLISFVVFLYLVVSVVRELDDADFLCSVLVGGGALVAAAAVWESLAGYNVFNHLEGVVPLLRLSSAVDAFPRGEGIRAYASSQHPIALGAMLVMLLPLAAYLVQRTRRWWWLLAGLVIAAGAYTTISRTAVIMLLVAVLVLALLRPRTSWRLAVLLGLATVFAQLAVPGALVSLKEAFFPTGGLIAEQTAAIGTLGQGRVADIAPTLSQVTQQPWFGTGFGTLVPVGPDANTLLLDNQWLGTLLETGIVGAAALVWLFALVVLKAAATARREDSDRGWLLAAVAASVVAYAVGMLTYDAFSFIQVTFVLFVLLGLAAAMLRHEGSPGVPT
jgi:O-antigen ligase